MNMIEKVARELAGITFDIHQTKWEKTESLRIGYINTNFDQYIDYAKAAIEAMREPSDYMLVQIEEDVPELSSFNKKVESLSYLAWQSGIDAALKEE